MSLLSVIIPAYNEEGNIIRISQKLKEVLEGGEAIPYEIVFVNDGSKDNTFGEITKAAKANKNIVGVNFSRNFGKEAAIFAGLQMAKGDCAVVIDCDLQHPAEVIPQMYQLWKDGFEIVEGIKSNRGKENFLHKLMANSFYCLMSKMIKMDMQNTSDFKLIDRKVIDILLQLTERNTFFRALSFWTGFHSTVIEYEVQERECGESKWSVWGLFKYAINNMTSFSTAPLQIVTGLGMILIGGSIVLMIQTLYRFLSGNAVEGFTTVILLILIIGGFIMISMGIIGHYLARIYEEVKGRPRFIVKDVVGHRGDT